MSKEFVVNVNETVRVKLTDKGREILKQKYGQLNMQLQLMGVKEQFNNDIPIDETGYYEVQLWALMKDFGGHMGLGKEMCFEANMIFKQKLN